MSTSAPTTATSSAPGKVYLCGEHAVVHGEPAIACAIERRATVTADPRDDSRVRVTASDLSLSEFTVEYSDAAANTDPRVDAPSSLVTSAIKYINAAVEQARDALDDDTAGFDITVESDIPLGAGLGSSAAVVVAGIDAATRAYGTELETDDLAERAYNAEHTVQNGEASRADTFCSARGGAVLVKSSQCEPLATPRIPLVIGYDGGGGSTEELVAGVRERMRSGAVKSTIRTIGDAAREGRGWFAAVEAEGGEPSGELLDELGETMNVNHGLLSAIGVSSRSLDTMVWGVRNAGARGAKLTGAGGGGCIVALADGNRDVLQQALEFVPDCEESFNADVAETGVKRHQ